MALEETVVLRDALVRIELDDELRSLEPPTGSTGV